MNIVFSSDVLRRMCHDQSVACRSLDIVVARKLRARLDDLSAAKTLSYAAKLPGRFHALADNGRFALHLSTDVKLVVAPAGLPLPLRDDGSVDLDKVDSITVISIGKGHE